MQVKVLIEGRVQGVFFRRYTKDQALKLGLKGWVRNLKSGEVETVFSGPKDKVEQMIDWCKKGPSGSRVDKVTVTRIKNEEGELGGFEIN